jgi:N-acetylneuraminate synthase
MEPEEMRQLVVETNNAWKALGEVRYGVEESEKGSIQFRRSIYVVQDVKAGDLVSRDNVRCIRPGYGMQPKYLNKVIGKKFITDISAGTPLGKALFN